jgi:SAM-dependent methyltransferase
MYGDTNMTTESKPWEIWTENEAAKLARLWRKPGHRGGRHWLLIKRSADQIDDGSVLDVGCGHGHLYALIKDRVTDYLGIDTSEPQLNIAREFFTGEKDKFQYGSIYELEDYPMFDTVACVSVVVHLPDPHDELIQALWSKARKSLVIETWKGKKSTIRSQRRPEKKFCILHWKPDEEYEQMFAELPDVKEIIKDDFDRRSTIFKLIRK